MSDEILHNMLYRNHILPHIILKIQLLSLFFCLFSSGLTFADEEQISNLRNFKPNNFDTFEN